MARTTVSTLSARVDALDTKMDQILAILEGNAPAKPARKPAKKAARKPKADAPLPKGVRMTRASGGTLSRKDWNRTLTAKAKFAGGDTYRRVIAVWSEVQEQRATGMTPDEVLATFVA